MPADSSQPNTPNGISIDFRALPWSSRFANDYCHEFSRLQEFFVADPKQPDSWKTVIDVRRAKPTDPRIGETVVQQLQERGAPDAALSNAKQLLNKKSVAIATGQQAGLFGGPLFTVLKALTTIKLARQVSADHDIPVVPIFWIDAEDHDLDEISSCQFLDTNMNLSNITLPLEVPPGTTAASIRLNSSISEILEQLTAGLQPTEFAEETRKALRTAYAPGTRLVEAFARWLDTLLGKYGLVTYDASDPRTKAIVQPLFAQELESQGRTSRLAAAAGAAMEAKGYSSQVSPALDTTALFQIDSQRKAIRISDSGFLVDGQQMSTEQMCSELKTQPEHFSPNVLLRPLIQDVLFPTIAYVAGPHELVYLGQLREIYDSFDVPMPIIYPRASVTVVDSSTIKFLNRNKIDFVTLKAQDDVALNTLLAEQLPDEINTAVTALSQSISEQLSNIELAVPDVDPTLGGAVQSTHSRMDKELRNLRAKIIQAAKRRDETLRRQFSRARSHSFPDGSPQERSVGSIYFINRYGEAFFDRLLEQLPLETGRHWLLKI